VSTESRDVRVAAKLAERPKRTDISLPTRKAADKTLTIRGRVVLVLCLAVPVGMFGASGLWLLFEGSDGDTDLSRAMTVVASVLWGLVSTYVVARGRERGSLGRIAIATSTGLAAGIVVGLSFIGFVLVVALLFFRDSS